MDTPRAVIVNLIRMSCKRILSDIFEDGNNLDFIVMI